MEYHSTLIRNEIFLTKILFILFLEMGRWGEIEGEKHQCVVAF